MKRTTKTKGTPIPSSGMRGAQEILSSESFDSAVMEDSFEEESPYDFHDVQQHAPPNSFPQQHQLPSSQQEEAFDIMRNIASYLTLADATSMASMSDLQPRSASSAFRSSPVHDDEGANEDWAIGTELSTSDQPSLAMLPSWASLTTPATPGLIALSPMECDPDEHDGDDDNETSTDSWNEERIQRRLEQQRKQWVQQKLTAAVFSHPQSIRSYCLETHQAALDIRKARQDQMVALKKAGDEPETELPERKPIVVRGRRKRKRRAQLLQMFVDTVLNNVPLSVLLDLAESCLETSLDTSFSVIKLSAASINAIVTALVRLVQKLWDIVTNFNPFAVLDAIISLQFDAMGRTSEVLASGIQSVATGVGSASNIALQRLSRSGADKMSSSSLHAHGLLSSRGPRRSVNEILNKKLIRKLSDINDAAELVAYSERENDGLTRTAKKRVQKMMHYEVSLRPFTATVIIPPSSGSDDDDTETFGNVDFPGYGEEVRAASSSSSDERGKLTPQSSESSSPHSSPFMATPKSFPPTPGSRSLVMSKGHRFTEDVVYFARDQLRVEDGLGSENERTRAMSNALRKGSRLAVFNAADVSNGISLTCGQHVATKVGNVLYCSTRSMVPVLRNVYVYFEMSVLSSVERDAPGSQGSMAATLSVGLSTLEMPLNTLVGAWKGSVGLCSTGQILTAGQWVSPSDLSRSCYGDRSTVGCLVCLDDSSAFETWDGIMATASVTFNVNGAVVSPPAGAASMMGAPMAVQVPPLPFTSGTSPDSGATYPPPPPQHGPLQPTSTLPLLVPMEEELFPTLTLHSPSTQVMCRFSKEDILATTRDSIGAPRGVTVYAVDGSVMLDERE